MSSEDETPNHKVKKKNEEILERVSQQPTKDERQKKRKNPKKKSKKQKVQEDESEGPQTERKLVKKNRETK